MESNGLLRDYLQHLFRTRYPRVQLAAVGDRHEAIECARSNPPHVVIVHVRPGGGKAFELIRELRRVAPVARVVFVSDYDLPEYREAAKRCGADQCLATDTVRAEDILALVSSTRERGASA